MRNLLIFIFLITLFCSCSKNSSVSNEGPFFDLTEYVEMVLATDTIQDIERIIISNGDEEKVSIDQFNMRKPIEYLKEFNINNPKFYDKYTITYTDGLEEYNALDESMKVKNVKLYSEENNLVKIIVDYQVETIISTMQKTIVFDVDKRLSIKNHTESILGKEQDLEMIWEW